MSGTCVQAACSVDEDCVIAGLECESVGGVNRCVATCPSVNQAGDDHCRDVQIMPGTKCIQSGSVRYCAEDI
jgi:hypothetical protein